MRTEIGWLDSRHTFSFAEHYDPRYMGFRALRVLNEDRVAPGQGFGTHPHRDMEILSYVLEGALSHQDSMGTGSIIKPGDVQRMTAGTGVLHSEFNASETQLVHFLQIWLMPARTRLEPSYEQKAFPAKDRSGRFTLVASHDGRDGSVTIHQDALLFAGLFDGEESAQHAIAAGRKGYVHVARGRVGVNGHVLSAGDALKTGAVNIAVSGGQAAEVLVFDLPASAH